MDKHTARLYVQMRHLPRVELEMLAELLKEKRLASQNVHACSSIESAIGHVLYTLDCEQRAAQLVEKADKMHDAACAAQKEADAQIERNQAFELNTRQIADE